ncbi:MAG: hypothetical protein EBQ99_05255 [Planctomycetes bacterium]|nr:hypothetical protein [Planctomycetota bacterium]
MRWGALLILLLPARLALGDGGVPIASRMTDSGRVTLLMAPSGPVVGPVRFTLLGAAAGHRDVEVLQDGHRERTPLESEPDRPGWHATLSFEQAGPARVIVHGSGQDPLLLAEVMVSQADPSWLQRWPWTVAWVPVLALVALREWRVRRRIHWRRQHGEPAIH